MKAITSLIQNAYGGLSRSVWLLSLTQLINRAGTMVVFFLAVYLKDELHYDYNQVGIVMSMFGAGSLLGVFVGGKLADKIGYFPVMVMSLAVGGLLFLLTSQIDHFPMLCVGMFLLSAFGEAFRPAAMVAIAHYSDKDNYTRSISLYRLALNLGFAVGPALGGFLAAINYRLIFWADGITCIAGALMVLFFLKKTHDRERNEIKESVPVSEAVRSAYADKAYFYRYWFCMPCPSFNSSPPCRFITKMKRCYLKKKLDCSSRLMVLLWLRWK